MFSNLDKTAVEFEGKKPNFKRTNPMIIKPNKNAVWFNVETKISISKSSKYALKSTKFARNSKKLAKWIFVKDIAVKN